MTNAILGGAVAVVVGVVTALLTQLFRPSRRLRDELAADVEILAGLRGQVREDLSLTINDRAAVLQARARYPRLRLGDLPFALGTAVLTSMSYLWWYELARQSGRLESAVTAAAMVATGIVYFVPTWLLGRRVMARACKRIQYINDRSTQEFADDEISAIDLWSSVLGATWGTFGALLIAPPIGVLVEAVSTSVRAGSVVALVAFVVVIMYVARFYSSAEALFWNVADVGYDERFKKAPGFKVFDDFRLVRAARRAHKKELVVKRREASFRKGRPRRGTTTRRATAAPGNSQVSDPPSASAASSSPRQP